MRTRERVKNEQRGTAAVTKRLCARGFEGKHARPAAVDGAGALRAQKKRPRSLLSLIHNPPLLLLDLTTSFLLSFWGPARLLCPGGQHI